MANMNEVRKAIAKNVKELRLDNNLTQRAMADLLRLNVQYYAAIERANDPIRHFTLEKILEICAIFDKSPNDIITVLPDVNEKYDLARDKMSKDIYKDLPDLSFNELKKIRRYINMFKGEGNVRGNQQNTQQNN